MLVADANKAMLGRCKGALDVIVAAMRAYSGDTELQRHGQLLQDMLSNNGRVWWI